MLIKYYAILIIMVIKDITQDKYFDTIIELGCKDIEVQGMLSEIEEF